MGGLLAGIGAALQTGGKAMTDIYMQKLLIEAQEQRDNRLAELQDKYGMKRLAEEDKLAAARQKEAYGQAQTLQKQGFEHAENLNKELKDFQLALTKEDKEFRLALAKQTAAKNPYVQLYGFLESKVGEDKAKEIMLNNLTGASKEKSFLEWIPGYMKAAGIQPDQMEDPQMMEKLYGVYSAAASKGKGAATAKASSAPGELPEFLKGSDQGGSLLGFLRPKARAGDSTLGQGIRQDVEAFKDTQKKAGLLQQPWNTGAGPNYGW